MPNHVFLELKFFALVLFSLVLPTLLYVFLYRRRSISRVAVILFAVALIAIAGIDVALLRALAELARSTPGTFDDWVFSSEISAALYVMPAVFAGIGVNLLSHVLIDHLHHAESRHDREGRQSAGSRAT
jgi:hypothetical protein